MNIVLVIIQIFSQVWIQTKLVEGLIPRSPGEAEELVNEITVMGHKFTKDSFLEAEEEGDEVVDRADLTTPGS